MRVVRQAERLDDQQQPEALGRPDEDRQDDERPAAAAGDRAEHALLEPVVELQRRDRGSGSRRGSRRPKLRSGEQARPRAATMTPMPIDRPRLDLGRQAVPEAPVAGGEAHHRDREQVEDALDEHRARTSATSDTSALILSRNARYRSPSLAGTRQLTVHDRNRISVESLMPIVDAGAARAASPSAGRASGSRRRTRGTRRAASSLFALAMRFGELGEVDVQARPGRSGPAAPAGMPSEMIVRGCRSRAPSDIWPPSSLGPPRRRAVAAGRGCESSRPRGPAGWSRRSGRGVGVGHGRLSLMAGTRAAGRAVGRPARCPGRD